MSVTAANPAAGRLAPELEFVAAVALRFDSPLSVGETPDGIRLHFRVHGTLEGPTLRGEFPPCMAYLRIDKDGVGTIHVRAPLLLKDGALAELDSTGRYDFGEDGYHRAIAGDLPDSALGWCPRFYTGSAKYLWLNRTQFLGVGELLPRKTSVDYDLFAIGVPRGSAATIGGRASLYQRLGGKPGIDRIVDGFVDALMNSETLHRQNPAVRAAHARVSPQELKRKVAEVFCRLSGGDCQYEGRPLAVAHAPLSITEADWRLAGDELVKVLASNGVSDLDARDLLDVIQGTKSHIVTAQAPTVWPSYGKGLRIR